MNTALSRVDSIGRSSPNFLDLTSLFFFFQWEGEEVTSIFSPLSHQRDYERACSSSHFDNSFSFLPPSRANMEGKGFSLPFYGVAWQGAPYFLFLRSYRWSFPFFFLLLSQRVERLCTPKEKATPFLSLHLFPPPPPRVEKECLFLPSLDVSRLPPYFNLSSLSFLHEQ